MAQFIPYSDEKEAELSEKLNNTLFKNVETFIQFYNSGMIAKRSEEIVELTRNVVETFKNVEEKNNLIVFLSSEEVFLDEIFTLLEPWKYIVKIKRELEENIKNEKVRYEDILVFSKKDSFGYILKVSQKDGENVLEKIGNEKIFTKEEQISDISEKISTINETNDEYFYFKVSDFLNVDDSFVERIHNEVPKF